MRIPTLIAALALAASGPAFAAESGKVFRYAFLITETGFDPVELVPSTLEAMPEISENGTLYRLRVKPGIYFADDPVFNGGKRELTAQDFVYSIKRHFDPKKKSPNLYQLEGQIAGMDEILARARKANQMDYDAEVEGLRNSPWRLQVHRFYNDLLHPWVTGYLRHPVMRGWWKYIDIDVPRHAAANGR